MKMQRAIRPAEAADDGGEKVCYYVRCAYTEADGDRRKAIAILAAQVRKNDLLRRALLDPLIEYACDHAIGRAIRSWRQGVWNKTVAFVSATEEEKVRLLAKSNLLIFPLPCGKFIGEATREEIANSAVDYEKKADDMQHKSHWLRLVSQSIPSGVLCKDVLSNERLCELQELAFHE